MVRYPDCAFNIDYGYQIDSPIGRIWFNQPALMDYAPADDIEYFKSADEAAEAEQSVLGRDFIKLMKKRGWVLQPGDSAVLQTNGDGAPAGVSLYFDKGGKVARVNFGQFDIYSDLRITLPDGRVLRMGGDGYESSITSADVFMERHYLDISGDWQAGFCGRIDCGVPFYRFATASASKLVAWSVETCGADESDLMDIIAMALYGVSDSDHFSQGSKVGEDFDISGYEYGSEFDTEYGYITPNPMVRYDDSDMRFTSDTGEQEISAEKAAVFAAANTPGGPVNVPFEADSVTKRTAAADGGYVSECVTWKQGDTKLLKINFITNGDALPGYGEEFGTENIQPTRTWLDKTGKRVRVVAAGAKVPTGDYWLYAINDSDDGNYTTVTAKGLSIEEFAKILQEVYVDNFE